jgi:phage shock protein C
MERARNIGLRRVLLVCADDNIGSWRIIEANGVCWRARFGYASDPSRSGATGSIFAAAPTNHRVWLQPRSHPLRHMRMDLKKRIYRSRRDRMVAGVSGGLADYFDVDPSIVRLIWLASFVATGGMTLFVYLAAALVIPSEPGSTWV